MPLSDLDFCPSYEEMEAEKKRGEREEKIKDLFITELEKQKAELGRGLTREEYDDLLMKTRKRVEEEGLAETGENANATESEAKSPETEEKITESEVSPECIPPEPSEKAWKELEKKQQKYQRELQSLASSIQATESSIAELKSQLKDEKDILKGYYKRLLKWTQKGVDSQLEMDLPDAENPEADKETKEETEEDSPSDDWKKWPVSVLALSDSLKAKLAENFETCGEVWDWIGSDFSKQIKGLGESSRDKVRGAIDKIAGVTDDAIHQEAERGKQDRENEVERDPEKVMELLEEINHMYGDERYEYANDTLEGISDWVENKQCYTTKQWAAIRNIQNGAEPEPWEN